MKVVSDFHPRHPISGLCQGLFRVDFVTSVMNNEL